MEIRSHFPEPGHNLERQAGTLNYKVFIIHHKKIQKFIQTVPLIGHQILVYSVIIALQPGSLLTVLNDTERILGS